MVWYGMVWYGMVWYGMVWYGMAWYGTGLATGFYRRLKPDKTGPDNTPKSGFYRLLLAFTIFLLFSSIKTVLPFYMFIK